MSPSPLSERDAAQRKKLDVRLAGRPRKALDLDDLSAPYLLEDEARPIEAIEQESLHVEWERRLRDGTLSERKIVGSP